MRPMILDAGLITVCQDFVVPASLERLSQTHRSALTRMSQFYDSLVSKNEHLYAPPKEVVARRTDPAGPPVLAGTCGNCGKRCNRDCKFRRCKDCCNAALLRCPIHVVGLRLREGQTLTDRAPPLPLLTPSPPAPAAVPKHTRRTAPSVPKPASVLLGDREATEPWSELREEALYRSLQNGSAMDTIFNHTTTDALSSQLNDWQSRLRQPLEDRLALLQDQSALLQQQHQQRLASWTQRAENFMLKYSEVGQLATEQELAEARRQWLQNLDGVLPVPLTPRKRSAESEPPMTSPPKIKPIKP